MPAVADALRAYLKAAAEATAANKEAEQKKNEKGRAKKNLLHVLEVEEQDSAKVDGQLASRYEMVFASVNNREEFAEWAREQDEEFFEPEVRIRTDLLNQTVRELIDNGQPIPPGVTIYVEDRISVKKATPKVSHA